MSRSQLRRTILESEVLVVDENTIEIAGIRYVREADREGLHVTPHKVDDDGQLIEADIEGHGLFRWVEADREGREGAVPEGGYRAGYSKGLEDAGVVRADIKRWLTGPHAEARRGRLMRSEPIDAGPDKGKYLSRFVTDEPVSSLLHREALIVPTVSPEPDEENDAKSR